MLFVLSQNATFLAILATDGQISFSRFLYGPINGQIDYLIGFNAGDGRGLQLAKQTGPLTPEQEDIVGVSYRIDGKFLFLNTVIYLSVSFTISGIITSLSPHKVEHAPSLLLLIIIMITIFGWLALVVTIPL